MTLLAKLNRLLLAVSATALIIIIVVTLADVLSAWLRGRPITGVYEVVETALVYLVFLGIPETFRNDQNITVNVADHFLAPPAIALLRSFGAIIAVCYMALLEWSMISPALDALKFGDFKSESGIPFWFIWAPILLGTAFAIIGSAFVMMRAVRSRASASE